MFEELPLEFWLLYTLPMGQNRSKEEVRARTLVGAVEDVDIDLARRQFETNLFGAVAVIQAALPAMRRAGSGVVVGVSSLAGRIPVPLMGMYSGSKLATYLHGTRIGVVVEFEGDDVAAKDVAMHIAAMKPAALSSADVPADLVEKERKIATEKAAESGKPADIVAKMVEGSVQKFLKEVSLLDQVFVKAADGKQTVGAHLKAANTTVKGFTLYVVGEGIEKKVDDFAAEVAAQVAAAKGQ